MTTASSRSTALRSRSVASRSWRASPVSSRSLEVIPKWIHRPAGPTDSETHCTNAATSWLVTRSRSLTRSTEKDARERMASMSSWGIRPSRAHASHARTSMRSQCRMRASSDHTAPISGRV